MFAPLVHWLFHEWHSWNTPVMGRESRTCRSCHRYQVRKVRDGR